MPKEGFCKVFPTSRPDLCGIVSSRLKDIKDTQRHRMPIINAKWYSGTFILRNGIRPQQSDRLVATEVGRVSGRPC
jgi:hypothetical protein